MNELIPDVRPTSLTLTKTHQQKAAEYLAGQALEHGNTDPLTLWVALRWQAEVCEMASKILKPYAIDEATKYGKGDAPFGVKLEVKSAAGRYAYDHDPEYIRLKAQLQAHMDRMQGLVKVGSAEVADTETSEVLLAAKYTPGDTTLSLTFPK